jgi:hypothetical protein
MDVPHARHHEPSGPATLGLDIAPPAAHALAATTAASPGRRGLNRGRAQRVRLGYGTIALPLAATSRAVACVPRGARVRYGLGPCLQEEERLRPNGMRAGPADLEHSAAPRLGTVRFGVASGPELKSCPRAPSTVSLREETVVVVVAAREEPGAARQRTVVGPPPRHRCAQQPARAGVSFDSLPPTARHPRRARSPSRARAICRSARARGGSSPGPALVISRGSRNPLVAAGRW